VRLDVRGVVPFTLSFLADEVFPFWFLSFFRPYFSITVISPPARYTTLGHRPTDPQVSVFDLTLFPPESTNMPARHSLSLSAERYIFLLFTSTGESLFKLPLPSSLGTTLPAPSWKKVRSPAISVDFLFFFAIRRRVFWLIVQRLVDLPDPVPPPAEEMFRFVTVLFCS